MSRALTQSWCLQALLDSDKKLAQHEDHFQYRFALFDKLKRTVEADSGSLAEFAAVSTCFVLWASAAYASS